MKIGILTFQQSHFRFVQRHNYGAILQAYALKETLKSVNKVGEVEVIDYKPDADYHKQYRRYFYRLNEYKSLNIKFKVFVNLVLTFPTVYLRRAGFMNFINSNLNLSKKKYRKFNTDTEYDAYFLGSDQIWNKIILGGYDPVYFGCFKTKDGAKKIAYAVSAGIRKMDNDDTVFFMNSINDLSAISVREKSLELLLQPLTEKKIETVLDPTLLANPIIWDGISKGPIRKRKYVLLFVLSENNEAKKAADFIAKKINGDVVSVAYENKWNPQKNIIQTATPQEFLGWIRNAEYVLTNSFHGVTFSIIFNRPFFSFLLNSSKDERVQNILSMFDLSTRGIYNSNDAINRFNHQINWRSVQSKLNIEREKSLNFIINSLKE